MCVCVVEVGNQPVPSARCTLIAVSYWSQWNWMKMNHWIRA